MSRSARSLATIRASILMRIVRALDAALGNADGFLAEHGLSRGQLADPYAAVPLRPYAALLEAAAQRVGDPHFGLRIGALLQPEDLGPAGLLLSTSRTLRQGVERFDRYSTTVQSGTRVELHDDGTWAAWAYQVEDPTVWPRVQDCELSMAVMCSLFRARLGPKWSPREVHFEHTGADPDATLRTFFRARIMFCRPVTQIVFETRDLDRELIVEGADITSVLERHADDLLAQQRGQQREAERPLTARVSRLIGAQLSREQITVAGVARAFGMSARTLQRELANEGTTLRALLREHRQTLAEARLTEGASSHGAIAQAMGYSDGTVFWRAFKRWSGKSPRAFRARVDDGGFERKK